MGYLIEQLGLKDEHELVHETVDKAVYAHTIYYEIEKINYDNFVTEDDTPVDNLFSEKQQRLLIDPLRANEWTDKRFMACANVAIYHPSRQYPVVPDMFISFDAKVPTTWFDKKDKCYFTWLMGKSPDLVVEIVSNKIGGERTEKFNIYATIGVKYYIIHDPYHELYKTDLQVFELDFTTNKYKPFENDHFYIPEITLGIKIWQGLFEDAEAPWARWCDREGDMILTGAERNVALAQENGTLAQENEILANAKAEAEAEASHAKAEAEKERTEKQQAKAEAEKERTEKQQAKAEAEKERAEKEHNEIKIQKLMEQLAALGLTPVE